MHFHDSLYAQHTTQVCYRYSLSAHAFLSAPKSNFFHLIKVKLSQIEFSPVINGNHFIPAVKRHGQWSCRTIGREKGQLWFLSHCNNLSVFDVFEWFSHQKNQMSMNVVVQPRSVIFLKRNIQQKLSGHNFVNGSQYCWWILMGGTWSIHLTQ